MQLSSDDLDALQELGAVQSADRSPAVEPASSDAGHPRVLLADDNETFRKGLRDLLEDQGVAVIGEAGDGFEAVTLADALTPDIILMDIKMPGLDGIRAARIIKDRNPLVEIIVLSAYDDPALRREAGESRVRGYLVKGSRPQYIHAALMDAWRGAPEPAAEGEASGSQGADIGLQLLPHEAGPAEDARGDDRLGLAADLAVESIRNLRVDLSPSTLDRDGLAEALRSLLARAAEETGIVFQVEDLTSGLVPQRVGGIAYRIAQASLALIHECSGPSRIEVRLTERGGGLAVEIGDDGLGIGADELRERPIGPRLSSLRQRAEAAGGHATASSLPNAGIRVEFWLPIDQPGPGGSTA